MQKPLCACSNDALSCFIAIDMLLQMTSHSKLVTVCKLPEDSCSSHERSGLCKAEHDDELCQYRQPTDQGMMMGFANEDNLQT